MVNTSSEEQYDVRIADFGLALVTTVPLTVKCGTPGYAAPEMLRGKGYGTKADIFSLGSLMFNLCTGRYLFAGKDKLEILTNNAKCDLSEISGYLGDYSKEAQELLFCLLEVEPEHRPTAREALEHPWFSGDETIIQDLLKANDNLCLKKKSFVVNDGQSFSSFKVASNLFLNLRFWNSKSQKESKNIKSDQDGSQSIETSNISYFNAIRSFKQKSQLQLSPLLPNTLPKINSTPLHFVRKNFQKSKFIDKSEESKKSYEEEEQQDEVINAIKDVDDIMLSTVVDLVECSEGGSSSLENLCEDLCRFRICDAVKMPSSMLMSNKNIKAIRVFNDC